MPFAEPSNVRSIYQTNHDEQVRQHAAIGSSQYPAKFAPQRGINMNGRSASITASDGGKFSGYLTLPKSANAPGVVIIQEIFGVNDHIREVVDEYPNFTSARRTPRFLPRCGTKSAAHSRDARTPRSSCTVARSTASIAPSKRHSIPRPRNLHACEHSICCSERSGFAPERGIRFVR